MDFFGDYSIEVASCHPSSLSHYKDNVFSTSDPFATPGPLSPRDTRTSYPIEFANMTNLAREFGLQSLDTSNSTSDCNDHYVVSSQQQYSQPPSPSRPAASSSLRALPCWKRRAQRQRDIHMQADPSHLRSIRELVERMVSDGDQCETTHGSRPTAIVTTTPSVPLTEGDEEDSEASDLSSPRSFSGSSNNSVYAASPTSPTYQTSAVSKSGRIQKTRAKRSAAGRDRR